MNDQAPIEDLTAPAGGETVDTSRESMEDITRELKEAFAAETGIEAPEAIPDAAEEGEGEPVAPAATKPDEIVGEEGDPTAAFGNDRDGIRKLRDAYKAAAKERKELQARLKDVETQAQSMQQRAHQPAPSVDEGVTALAEKHSAENLLLFLEKYDRGLLAPKDAEEEAAFQKLYEQAYSALEFKDAAEIYAVLNKAKSNGFGELSRGLLSTANETLARVQAVGNFRRQEQAAQQERQAIRQQAVKTVMETLKLKVADGKIDTSTPEGKEFTQSMAELAQAIPMLNDIPNAPALVMQYMQMNRKAAASDALAKENAELKAKLARLTGNIPAGDTATRSRSASSRDPKAELRAELAALGVGR